VIWKGPHQGPRRDDRRAAHPALMAVRPDEVVAAASRLPARA
jgi:hypothetical protein